MTKLLISVRSLSEAQVAWLGGVDLIDLKEPLRGSLGCPDVETARQVAQHVSGSLSIALGELNEWTSLDEILQFAAGFQYAKVGLAGFGNRANWREAWLGFADRMPTGVEPVLVAYADWKECDAPCVDSVFELAKSIFGSTVLIDTCQKLGGRLFDHLTVSTIQKLRDKHPDVCLALAGSLRAEDQDALAKLTPDIIALRGAVCLNDRASPLDSEKIGVWVRFCQSLSGPKASQICQTS